MRILLIHPSAHLNGAGRIIAALAKYLRRRGHTTRTVLPGEGPLTRNLGGDLGEYTLVPMTVLRRSVSAIIHHALEFPSTVRHLEKIISDWHPDVIHVNCLYTLWGGVAGRRKNVPVVYHVHEAPGSYPASLYRTWEAVVARLARRVVIVHPTLGAGVGRCRDKLLVIENGIDREHFRDHRQAHEWRERIAPQGEKIVLCPSHIMPGKNQKLLVEAAPLILDQHRATKIVFLGHTHGIKANEDYLRRLKMLAALNGSAERILFSAEPEDAVRVMAGADVIVSPSPYESFGLIPLEALAAGRPVVMMRTGIADELVRQGCAVRIVPTDSAYELARAVGELLTTTRLPARHALPEIFTAERMAERFESLYGSILADRR